MKEIVLTQGKVALVDDDDFEWLNKYNWHAAEGERDRTFYARKYIKENGKVKMLLLHRFIMGLSDSKAKVDHIDKNGLNNQRSNLRICTQQENSFNKRPCENKTSKYLGVYLRQVTKRGRLYTYWRAEIKKDNKSIRLGYFKTEESAALAYDAKARELFGEFANPNFKTPLVGV